MERTEPTSGLIQSFSNKVCWITNIMISLSQIMILSKWHRTRLKPTIQNFRGSLVSFPILDSSIVIYIWLMKINFCISIIIPIVNLDFCIFWKENFSLLCIVKITERLSCSATGIRMRYKDQSLTFCLVIPIFQSIFYS